MNIQGSIGSHISRSNTLREMWLAIIYSSVQQINIARKLDKNLVF